MNKGKVSGRSCFAISVLAKIIKKTFEALVC